ncbi:DUF4159 domain-containing protein [Nostoc sp. NIES-2111]
MNARRRAVPFLRPAFCASLLVLLALAAFAQYRGRNFWAQYEREMQDPVDDPPDALRPAEFTFARLRYRSDRDGRAYARWGIDANKGDRLFLWHLTRLTRLDTRPIEQIVDIDDDDIFNWPFLFAVSPGDWVISDSQARRLATYFSRGGFLMVDDFHNEREWASFMDGIRRAAPGARVVDLEDAESIFHIVYDMNERFRVPGANVVHGSGIERGGVEPRWRAVVDDSNRILVAVTFNQDVGDGWEFADDPEYPEKFSAQAIRLGVNYVLYSLTH